MSTIVNNQQAQSHAQLMCPHEYFTKFTNDMTHKYGKDQNYVKINKKMNGKLAKLQHIQMIEMKINPFIMYTYLSTHAFEGGI